MKLKQRITLVFDRLVSLLAILAALLLVFTLVSVIFEIVMRYFLNRPQEWVLPVAEFSLFCITFFLACWLLRREGHVSLDMVVERLSLRNRSLLCAVTSIIGAIVCLVILWYGIEVTIDYALKNVVASVLLRIPMAWLLIIIPLSMLLLFVQFLRRAYASLMTWRGLANREPRSSRPIS